MPWSPVHPEWNFLDNGDLEIRWTRRSRAGMIWPDHVEVPLAEEVEKYRLELSPAGGSGASIMIESEMPHVIISADQIGPFQAGEFDSLIAKVYQIGAYGVSEALVVEMPI
jgi:hypothetical protein